MSIAACAEITRKSDPDRFLATMAGPVSAREILFPLYAMNAEVARAPWVTKEPLIAEMRLQWWMDVLEEIASGATVRSHEVTSPLAGVLNPEQARHLQPLVEARRWDIAREGFADIRALIGHLDATAGRLGAVASELLSGSSAAGHDIGFVQGAARWLQAVPSYLAHGRHPLPGSAEDSIAALVHEARGRLSYARSLRGDVPKTAIPAMLVAFDAPLILDRAAKDPAAVLRGEIEPSEFRRRLRLLRQSATGRW